MTLTATLSDGANTSPRFGNMAATVQFKRDGIDIGTPVNVANNVATLTGADRFNTAVFYTDTGPSPLGSHSISAVYSGPTDSNYQDSGVNFPTPLTVTPSITSITVPNPPASPGGRETAPTLHPTRTAPPPTSWTCAYRSVGR